MNYVEEDRGFASPCWIWQRAMHPKGYGSLHIPGSGTPGRRTGAHRVYYEQAKGPIPEGLDIDHLCRVRACVNPDHLEAVTRKENIERGRGKKTHCPRGHTYDGENLYVDPKGARRCRVCKGIARHRWEVRHGV